MRKRRDPEQARAVIIDGAQRALLKFGPERVRLRDVAKEAGVSRGLVSHYFGTIDKVIEAAFQMHVQGQRQEFLARIAGGDINPRAWLSTLFDRVSAPLHGRLLAWSLISGRVHAEDFFLRREKGLARVVDGLMALLEREGKARPREQIEIDLLIAMSSTIGYVLARSSFWPSLGRDASLDVDAKFIERLSDLLFPETQEGPRRDGRLEERREHS